MPGAKIDLEGASDTGFICDPHFASAPRFSGGPGGEIRPLNGRIVGGQMTDIKQHRWQVALNVQIDGWGQQSSVEAICRADCLSSIRSLDLHRYFRAPSPGRGG